MLTAPKGRLICPESGWYPYDSDTFLSCGDMVIALPLVPSNAAGGIAEWVNRTSLNFLVTGEHIAIEAITTPGGVITAGVATGPGVVAAAVYHSINPLNVSCYNYASTRSAGPVTVANQFVRPGFAYNLSRVSGDMTGLRGWAFLKGKFLGNIPNNVGGAGDFLAQGRLAVPAEKGFLPVSTTTGYPMGEFTVIKPLVASDAAGGLFAWANPFPFPVMVSWLQTTVQTGSTGAGTFQGGVAANVTTSSSTLLSGINSQTVQSSLAAAAFTNSVVFANQVVPAGQAVTISRATGAMAGLVGWAKLSVLPMGTVTNS